MWQLIEEIIILLQHFLSVNPIFVVICGPKQPLQNCLSKVEDLRQDQS
jgi:hypothetical protein